MAETMAGRDGMACMVGRDFDLQHMMARSPSKKLSNHDRIVAPGIKHYGL